jgi:CHAT domain-containing protein
MKRRQILQGFPFITSVWASTAHAQSHIIVTKLFDLATKKHTEELFNHAAEKHKRELFDLIRSRAARHDFLYESTSARKISKILAGRSDEKDFPLESLYLKHTAVLFYSYKRSVLYPYGKGELMIWLVNEHGVSAYCKQDISENVINDAISSLIDSMNVSSLQLSRLSPMRASARAVAKSSRKPLNSCIDDLTQILLPVNIIEELAKVKHLIIVPVLGLGTVPYAILRPFKDDAYLIDKMSISIAPSLLDLEQALYAWNPREVFSSPLIIGNPEYPESSEWSFSNLPGAEEEAQAVAKMIDATPLIGKAATKINVVSHTQNSSLLYFATHGFASSNDPLNGGFLVLSAKTLDQSWWTAKEIQDMKLRAEIAILSACQMGLGKVHDAGIIGLARSFQLAGVPRVVMSLWNVNDQATNVLMQTFVKNLKDFIPSEALRLAMLEVREIYPNPSDWASLSQHAS